MQIHSLKSFIKSLQNDEWQKHTLAHIVWTKLSLANFILRILLGIITICIFDLILDFSKISAFLVCHA